MLRKRTRSVNLRHHMRRSSLRLPKYIGILNLDSELLFNASSYLNSLKPTKIANGASNVLPEGANVLQSPGFGMVLSDSPSVVSRDT